ncbi:Catalase-related peroxidase [Paraburkholderia piptadeniae]|uniref:Catalase-related peroxidase n=1 Tax=Paraburkholderia piptadeniae TaxID=1701573 RepID=A0A1N7SSG9_9BURK|nr:catalase family peroxidase [Paraburkholderia piptadeniae]SIT50424.1 Catalase-related peroxidase [Paraburkholderia piptadeniae]
MNPKSPAGAPRCIPCRFAAIGVAVLALAGGFAYTAGWLTPARLTTYRIIDQFQANAGPHPGYRRNHAKGLCVEGYFDSNGNAASISSAQVFASGRTPVIGRFAIPGSNPSAPDASVPIRSMALLFMQRDGQQWRTGMNSTPLFAVHTPEQFYQQLLAAKSDPKTGKPDPAKMKAFYAAHPETRPFQEWLKAHPASSGLANAAYYSINAFRFIDASRHEHAVRWSVEPDTPYAPVDPREKGDPDFLSKQLDEQLKHGDVRWHLIVTVANAGDPTNDATLQWPADRQRIDAGTVVVERSAPQTDGVCRDVNFDPTVLPDGIKPSDDPLLAARSAAYAVSYQRRTREEALHAAPATPKPERNPS